MRTLIAAAAIAASTGPLSGAAVLTASGDGVLGGSAAGLDLANNGSPSLEVQGFDELQGVFVRDGAVTVDFIVGTNIAVGDTQAGIDDFVSGLALPRGTYDSHVLHLDLPATGSIGSATFTFDAPIAALISTNGDAAELADTLLFFSDDDFGNAADYAGDALFRRIESDETFTLVDPTTLRVDGWRVGGGATDHLRVLTQAEIPLPASGLLLLTGVAALAAGRLRGVAARG